MALLRPDATVWTKHKRLCSWCTVTAALLVATVPTALPEAKAAWRALRRR